MAKTHTYEIELESLSLEGEMSFNGGGSAQISASGVIDKTLPQYKSLIKLWSLFNELCKDYGPITKIEIVDKEYAASLL